VGPELSEIGKQKTREYLLEAIVAPNAKIAQGFETAVFAMDDGRILSGIVRSENDDVCVIVLPSGEQLTIEKNRVEERASGQSGMPADIAKQITRAELRDLVEYLSSLQEKQTPAAAGGH
jgi:quinoprotein glucose dehydrogenase